jgi:hypothetical protein
MKTKLLFSFLLLASCSLLSYAQVPQGFNYQAVARDGTDPITTEIDVRITIQSESEGGTIFWVEEHTSVLPNASGLFSLVIGNGVRQPGSTADTFSDIDWSTGTKYIKTEIDPGTGYVTMGTSQLWSVPYSMTSGNISDTLSKLVVKEEPEADTNALFEVKNKTGQTVFAVYNAGVRIYIDNGTKGKKGGFAIGGFGSAKADVPGQEYFVVSRDSIRAYIYDDPTVKAAKGGFAIGGFGNAKGFTNDYMIISPDSARVYVNNAASSKGKKGGFAIGGFGAAKRTDPQRLFTVSDDSIRMYIDDDSKASKGGFAIGGFGNAKGTYKSFLDVATDVSGIINPSQNRILWYPLKNAFLSGKVLIESSANVGENSFSSGFESKAKGQYSQALGYQCVAEGESSVAIGFKSISNNLYSTSFGDNNTSNGQSSITVGSWNTTTGNNSVALGLSNRAVGPYSVAIGYDSETGTEAYSCAIGYKNKAYGPAAVALGGWSFANGQTSLAAGYGAETQGTDAFSMGHLTSAIGPQSQSFGDGSTSKKWASTAFGWGTSADATAAVAMGEYTTAQSYASLVIGRYNLVSGSDSWNDAEPAFIIGNGTSDVARSNSLTILKNGNVGIGYNNPASALHIDKSITGHVVYLKNSLNSSSGKGIALFAGQDGVNSGAELITFFSPNQTTLGTITQNGSGSVAYNTTSDSRLKENISDTRFAITDLMKIKVRDFNFINDETKTSLTGFVAQELFKIFPLAVSKPADSQSYWAVDYGKLTPLLVKAVQDQQQMIGELKTENLRLKTQNDNLLLRVENIETLLGQRTK